MPKVLACNILLEPALKTQHRVLPIRFTKSIRNTQTPILPFFLPITLFLTKPLFRKNKKGLDFVTGNDAIVTLGINPTRPDTGYGYIQYYTDLATENIFKVKTFTEKPTLEIAETFIQSGDFYGMPEYLLAVPKHGLILLKDIYQNCMNYLKQERNFIIPRKRKNI